MKFHLKLVRLGTLGEQTWQDAEALVLLASGAASSETGFTAEYPQSRPAACAHSHSLHSLPVPRPLFSITGLWTSDLLTHLLLRRFSLVPRT